MIPPLARRFVAGETSAEALDHARQLNERGVGAILNRLGEHYDRRSLADADATAYVGLIEDIADSDLRACVSVKPSQLGLSIEESVFRENLARVVDHASEGDVFVWLDMEDHTTVDATLDAFEDHARETGTVGVCLQSNLKRTRADLERLAGLPGKVRLVKGAYDPPGKVAYKDSARVNEAYREDLRYMFEHFEDGIAVGSHDPAMIALAEDLHAEFGTPFEVQMLMGVRESAQTDLADEYEVWQYVPYGSEWLAYFYRRVAERKENLTFALRALVSG
ncbi:MAG: proline dehydrogenase family protein [Haloarculaceae archaeon]